MNRIRCFFGALVLGTMSGAAVIPAAAAGTTGASVSSQIAAGKALVLRELKDGQIGAPIHGLRALRHASSVGNTSNVESSNWAGYADDHSSDNAYTYAQGTWKEPAITKKCKTVPGLVTLTAYWVGLDGYSDGTVEQEGTTNVCDNGAAYVFDWYEMYPAGPTVVNLIGSTDTITATTSTDLAGNYTLTIDDATTPADSFSVHTTCAPTTCLDTSAEWIAEAPCCTSETLSGVFPLTPYRSWSLRKAVSNSGAISTYPNDNITTENYNFTSVLQTTGSLGAHGTKFKTMFHASD